MTVTPGETRTRVVCDGLTRTRIVQFAAASGDLSPLHTDEPAARAAGFPSVLGHGMFVMALAADVVEEWFGREALRSFESRFVAPTWPGDSLVATATVESVEALVTIAVTVVNGAGDVVLTGTAECVDTFSNSE